MLRDRDGVKKCDMENTRWFARSDPLGPFQKSEWAPSAPTFRSEWALWEFLVPTSKNGPSEMVFFHCLGSPFGVKKSIKGSKYEKQFKKKHQWIDQKSMFFKACVVRNLFLAFGKVHIA